MTKELLVSSSPHETKVAVLEDDQLVEVYFQRDTDVGLVGGIYKGRVNRVLPGMQSAFVDIGLERDAFLYVSDFFEDSEEYDRVFTETENRVARLTSEPSPEPNHPVASETAGSEPETSAVQEAGPVPEEPSVTTGAAPTAPAVEASPASPAVEPRERRHRFLGRRHRRREQKFRGEHFAPRQEFPEHREQPSSAGFELLPGESLAKYGHGPADEQVPTETEGESSPSGLHGANETAKKEEIPQPPVAETSAADAVAAPSPVDEATEQQPASEAAVEAPEQSQSQIVPETGEMMGGTEGELSLSSGRPAGAQEEDSLAPEVTESVTPGSPQEPAEAEPPETSSTQPPEPQSYTLRDSHHRPRVAPRHRRGRGRFRPREGRRQNLTASSEEVPRGANRHPAAISELLKEGQEILVQIAKEPLGAKGARITSHIALPGRYLVYMPTIDHIGVSRKIGSEEERFRLRNLILENRGTLTGGFIVRTAGAGRSEEELKADLAFLTNLWNDIRAKAERSKAPALLHRDLTLVERILRDLLSPDFKSIRVDNEIEYEHVLEFVQRFQPSLISHVKLYTRDEPLFDEFGVQAELDHALKPKVWLKSGGYIVINQTEALVAIDVNTGKYVGKTNRLEDTIVKTNIDAVKEIVRQIRLRDLGGIIVIDFIDMDERRNRNKVVQALEEALRHDRAPTKILSFNEFGLVALTRKRVKQSLERTLCEPCPHCGGAGWIKSVATVCSEIRAEARKMASEIDGNILNLRVHPSVAASLKSRDGVLISEIEAATRKEIVIKSDPEVHQERFEIF